MRTYALLAVSLLALVAPASAQTAPQQPVAVESMNRQQLRDEVTRLRGIVQRGAVRTQRPAGCTTAEHRQFDFWIGEWDAVASSASANFAAAESTITLHDQGCVIIEYWRPFSGAHGHSINMYDATDQSWHQTWMDSTGRRTEYRGTMQDGTLYLDMQNPQPGPNGQTQRQRMNFRPIDENTVRQWGESFDPATSQWTVTWDLTYRRRANSRP